MAKCPVFESRRVYQSISRPTSAGLALRDIVALAHNPVKSALKHRVPCRIAKVQTIKYGQDPRKFIGVSAKRISFKHWYSTALVVEVADGSATS